MFATTFGSCPSCGDGHLLWPERKFHVDWDESQSIEHGPDAIRCALEVLAAAADGSPGCNEPSLRILVASTYEAMSEMRMGAWAQRQYRKRRQSGQDPMLAQETVLYVFLSMTLMWSSMYATASGQGVDKVLEFVTDQANAAATSIPQERRQAAESLLVAAVQQAPEHGEDLEGLFSALSLSCRMLEKLSKHLRGNKTDNQVGILLAAANYALYAGTLVSRMDSV
ncbi:hypothetical protein [Streptomyces sp. NBC_00996]|uniref:hypothetical protein n=1 Tax=Streptomyces sp. NBC_00996 TaxID=2903710 RepID=UPI0038669301|nr:hypothetical protein OG390_00115 [Streptomyces sp. NBC_00996]